MTSDSRKTFFRQSGWMVLTATAGGVFMSAVHMIAGKIAPENYAVFVTLLRCLIVLGIPAAGLQTVFAQQTAAAVTEPELQKLRRTTRSVIGAVFLAWIAMALAVFATQTQILALLNIENATALWITVLIVFASLCLPVLRGILQGQQNFMGFGWSSIVDGVGRFSAVCVIVFVFKGQAAGAMSAALIGQIGALTLCLWWTRDIWRGTGAPFCWRDWFARLAPLTFGFGALMFMQNADVIFVQSVFPKDASPYYMATAMIGSSLVQLTGPIVAVMFPKIVHSMARAERTDALKLTFITTAVVGGLAAIVCTIFPELPIRILYFLKPDYLKATPLIPWFVWCMVLTTLANVLIGNLLARKDFAIVPWIVLATIGYGVALYLLKDSLKTLPAFIGFKRVIATLGVFNFILLVIAAWFSWRKKPTRVANLEAVAAR